MDAKRNSTRDNNYVSSRSNTQNLPLDREIPFLTPTVPQIVPRGGIAVKPLPAPDKAFAFCTEFFE